MSKTEKRQIQRGDIYFANLSPSIGSEQAEVVRQICDSFLAGHSVRMIKAELERQGIPASKGGAGWSAAEPRKGRRLPPLRI